MTMRGINWDVEESATEVNDAEVVGTMDLASEIFQQGQWVGISLGLGVQRSKIPARPDLLGPSLGDQMEAGCPICI